MERQDFENYLASLEPWAAQEVREDQELVDALAKALVLIDRRYGSNPVDPEAFSACKSIHLLLDDILPDWQLDYESKESRA